MSVETANRLPGDSPDGTPPSPLPLDPGPRRSAARPASTAGVDQTGPARSQSLHAEVEAPAPAPSSAARDWAPSAEADTPRSTPDTPGHDLAADASRDRNAGGPLLDEARDSTPPSAASEGSPRPAPDVAGQSVHAPGRGTLAGDHLSDGAEVRSPTTASASVGSPRRTPDAVGQSRDAPAGLGASADGYLSLRAIADVYEDVQRTRIAIDNRVDRAPIDVDLLAARLGGLKDTEHQVALLMRRTYRQVVPPAIRAWQQETHGIGEHLLARLLGVIGDPVWMRRHARQEDGTFVVIEERDRTVDELWSYCGHGDATRRRRRGMTVEEAAALGTPRAKMIVHLLAESCVKHKARSPYGPLYDWARAKYADSNADHATRSRKQAERAGWTPSHQHNAALRLVGKEILRDLHRTGKATA